MRKLIFNLHLYTALAAGLVLSVLGITGCMIAFENDLDRLFNPALFKVHPGPQALPVKTLQSAIQQAYPNQKSYLLFLPSEADQAYYTQSRDMQIFVDGYTGKIIGTRSVPTLLMRIHSLHLRLLLGAPGATIVTVVGFILIGLVFSGIYLWWPQKRITVKSGGTFLRFAFDLHNSAGIYSAAFLLVLALTGIFIHFDQEIEVGLNNLTHSPTPLRNHPSIVQKGVSPILPDAAIQIARAAVPGATPKILISPVGPRGSYSVVMPFPEDLAGGGSWVNVDQYSGQALFVENSRRTSPGTRVKMTNRAVHTGDIFGYPTKILMSAASLTVVIQVVTGYWLWWKKLRVRARQRTTRA